MVNVEENIAQLQGNRWTISGNVMFARLKNIALRKTLTCK